MLNQITNPTEYINAVSKLLPYAIGKKKAYEEIEKIEPIEITINFTGTDEENQSKLLNILLNKIKKPS